MSYYSYKQKPKQDLEEPIYPFRVQQLMAAYDRNNIVYQLKKEDREEMRLEDAERRGFGKIQSFVTWITRLKTDKRFVINQESDEVLIYYMRRFVPDYAKIPIYDHRTHGYILEPVTSPKVNPMSGMIEKYEPTSEKPFFWIPFSKEAVDKILAESITGCDQFQIGYANPTGPNIVQKDELFTIRNIDDFKEGTFSELWDMGRMNYTATEPSLERWRSEQKEIKKQAKIFKSLSNNQQQGQ